MADPSTRRVRPARVAMLAAGALAASAVLTAVLFSDRNAPAAWYSLLPPAVAVVAALLTHRVLFSLGLAVLVGGLLTHVPLDPGSPGAWWRGTQQAGEYLTRAFVVPSDSGGYDVQGDNVKLMIFVFLMMATITVAVAAGGLQGIVNRFARLARGVRSTQLATALAGVVVFIDDYANSMIVGNSMRPLTDKHRVSREKLAFLVDATSAPVAGLALVSTWIGFEVSLFQQQADALALGRDGYSMFLDAVAFRFYCLMLLVFLVANAVSGKDFGPMAAAERRARAGDPVGPSAGLEGSNGAQPDARARVWAAAGVIPIAGIFVALIAGVWVNVVGFGRLLDDPGAMFTADTWRHVVLSKDKDVSLVLAVSGAVSLFLAVGCALGLARLSPARVARAALAGVRVSVLPAIILVLAWSLKNTCDGLQTGEYLRAAVSGVASPLWFPPLVFVIAGATAFATGSSWTTMLILIPTATPIAFALDGDTYGPVTIICLAAVLDGAIFGDHCSPISDTTILSSAASACDHLRHVRTQLPYAVLVAVLALGCGYIPAALGAPPWVGLLAATAIIVTLFVLLRPLKVGPAEEPVPEPAPDERAAA